VLPAHAFPPRLGVGPGLAPRADRALGPCGRACLCRSRQRAAVPPLPRLVL